MASSELRLLLHALEERSLSYGPDDVAWAFESKKSQHDTVSWVRNYLAPASLLTSEERAFTDKQGSKAANSDVLVQEVSKQSFEDAISSLETSIAAIEKQCRLLEAQRRALQSIQKRKGGPSEKGSWASGKDSKISRERSQLEYQSNELANSLREQLRMASKSSDGISGSAQPSVERVLEKDDRLLDGLEKILPHLLAHEDRNNMEESERLCNALTQFTSADIRTRIDAAYLDGISQTATHANGVNGKTSRETQQQTSLNAELDELCREIDGLSTMAVDNQFRNPIMNATATARSDAEIERAAWADYLCSAIQFSTARMEHLHEQIEDQRAHISATKCISAALDEVLAASAGKQEESQRTPRSPIKSMQKGLKPLRLVQANLSDTQDPASQLLRQLDMRGEAESSSLAHSLAEKAEKLRHLQANSERNVSDQIAQSLCHADMDVHDLLAAVFAHSKYGSVHTESEAVRNGIDDLESKTQELSETMRNLDTDTIIRTTQAKHAQLLQQASNR